MLLFLAKYWPVVPPVGTPTPGVPCGMPKLNTAAELVPLLVTVAEEPGDSVVVVPTAIVAAGDDFKVTGDLTIKGVTQSITLDVEATGTATDPFGNLRAGFEGTGSLSRKDFGLTWNVALETGGLLVSDEIKLQLDISAIKQ